MLCGNTEVEWFVIWPRLLSLWMTELEAKLSLWLFHQCSFHCRKIPISYVFVTVHTWKTFTAFIICGIKSASCSINEYAIWCCFWYTYIAKMHKDMTYFNVILKCQLQNICICIKKIPSYFYKKKKKTFSERKLTLIAT